MTPKKRLKATQSRRDSGDAKTGAKRAPAGTRKPKAPPIKAELPEPRATFVF